MDFSFGLWPLECKVSVAAEQYSLYITTTTISPLDEKDVHLMGQHCPNHSWMVNKVHAAEHLLHNSSFLENFLSRDKKCGRNLQRFGGRNKLCFHHEDEGTYHL